jgi:putative membrane protein
MGPRGPRGENEVAVADAASRRTRLANERTYLAWWRTGLGSLALALGAGKLVPFIAKGDRWPYTVLGIGFAAVGVLFIALAFVRHRQVESAVARGRFAPPDDRLIAGIAAVGVLLGLVVLALVATTS